MPEAIENQSSLHAYHRAVRVMVAEPAMALETATVQRTLLCPRCGMGFAPVEVTVDPNLDDWAPLVEVKAHCPLCGWADDSRYGTDRRTGVAQPARLRRAWAGLEGNGGAVPFSHEQITRARRADLVAYLSACGYRLKRDGRGQYRVPGYGGLIVSGNHWYWHSQNRGGNALDFATQVLGMTFQEAVEALLDTPEAAAASPPPAQKTPAQDSPPAFRPPPAAPDHRRVRAYLTVVRRLPPETVTSLIEQGLVYEDAHGNCVFPCRDSTGAIRGAFLRGTDPHRCFRGLAGGSDSSYGWWWPPEPGPGSRIVAVTESPIDAASLVTLFPAFRGFHQLSLNGLRAGALERFLGDHPEVRTVILALDSDEPGQRAARKFREELTAKGYRAAILKPPAGHKDWNAALAASRD